MCGRHGGGLVVSIFPFYLDESGSNNTPESLKKILSCCLKRFKAWLNIFKI